MRRHFILSGRVQGVGFRWRASQIGEMLGLTGWVRNLEDGSVEMEAEGLAPERPVYRHHRDAGQDGAGRRRVRV